MVKKYSKKTSGGISLTTNFKVREFACKDGSDEILIDERLPGVLEKIRGALGNKAITINSGYRNATYNAKIGGAKASQHVQGTAADITIAGVKPVDICKAAEAALKASGIPGGIGLYNTFAHVDVRSNKSRWQNDNSTGNKEKSVSGWDLSTKVRPVLKQGSKGDEVRHLQERLNAHAKAGDVRLVVDGAFGVGTANAVKLFQSRNGLAIDGVVGSKTWVKLG